MHPKFPGWGKNRTADTLVRALGQFEGCLGGRSGGEMYVYLSKKINIPQGLKLKSLAWNSHQGWLACGTDHGIVKVLKLQEAGGTRESSKKDGFFTMQSNLSMNQTLEGHQGSVLVVSWNQNYRKLTSSDENGLIIVWILHKGMWFEEMINNRSKSVVRDMRWSSDGRRICIVYEDGHVVLGNVDGNRVWGKELNHRLVLVEWSPDGKLLLFCTKKGKCIVHDCHGHFVGNLTIFFKSSVSTVDIVGLHWYDGSEGVCDFNAPVLALALQSGHLQLMRHELDEEPVLIDAGMTTTAIKWSPNGTVLAVVGTETSEQAEVNSMVRLYSPYGVHLRTLHVPNSRVSALSWEGAGLRFALAVDSNIYLANIRLEYNWAFLGDNTCVYAFRKKHREEHCVMFWDLSTGDRHLKYVRRLVFVSGAAGHCVLATQGEDTGQYVLILCNAIGSPIESKYVAVQPLYMIMNASRVFVASEKAVYVWHYQRALQLSLSGLSDGLKDCKDSLSEEHVFHVDDSLPSADEDHICCMCASGKTLAIGRQSGFLYLYDLPSLKLEGKILLESKPQAIDLNCDSTKISVIDMNGSFSFCDIQDQVQRGKSTKHSGFSRKDVWNMKWADDNPDLIAIMEKARMYVLRGVEPEEPVPCSAYLCSFHNLQIRAIQLDEVMRQPEQPMRRHVFNYETKSLRDTLQILQAVETQDAYTYVEEHAHPRLWTSLAEHALERLDLCIAEKAFVKCRNFFGIQFVKTVQQLQNKELQKAEVNVYFKKFEDAERLYMNMDRKDLAINMRMKLGDWFIVEKLVDSTPGNDSLLQLARNCIGDYYSDRQKWNEAEPYYKNARNFQMLAEVYYASEQWNKLENMIDALEDGSQLLLSTGAKFESVGMCKQAVACFSRGGDSKAAIDCCLRLNDWESAVKLSKLHNCEEAIGDKLASYVKLLLESRNPAQAVQVHHRAGQHLEAAQILTDMAKARASKLMSVIEVKKIYVLAALEIEAARQENRTIGFIENPWHHPEAYHLWTLAHRQLYHGDAEQAMKTAWWLRDYEDVLRLVDIYSLIALTSIYTESYEHCSKAFVVLESLSDIPASQKEAFEQLAVSIFTKYKPVSPTRSRARKCPKCRAYLQDELNRKCSSCEAVFPICMASGVQILDEDAIQCNACKHLMLASKSKYQVHCALCHSPL